MRGKMEMKHLLVKLTSIKSETVYINPFHIRAIYVLKDGAHSIIYGPGENDFVQITAKEFYEQLIAMEEGEM